MALSSLRPYSKGFDQVDRAMHGGLGSRGKKIFLSSYIKTMNQGVSHEKSQN